MRLTICLITTIALCASSASSLAKTTTTTGFKLNETTWTFVDKKNGKVLESIDAKGNYIANTAKGKHLDHGTAVMKGRKACFTSAMDKKSETVCWTTRPVKIGHSMLTTSDKGEKLRVTRLKYAALEMPK